MVFAEKHLTQFPRPRFALGVPHVKVAFTGMVAFTRHGCRSLRYGHVFLTLMARVKMRSKVEANAMRSFGL